jgi:hypothetical protein
VRIIGERSGFINYRRDPSVFPWLGIILVALVFLLILVLK